MDVPPLAWALTILGDPWPAPLRLLLPRPQRARPPSARPQSGRRSTSASPCSSASASGSSAARRLGTEYFAGYITEKALSVDNLFVFLIIMASFQVPRADQQKVLLFGIVFSLVARTASSSSAPH